MEKKREDVVGRPVLWIMGWMTIMPLISSFSATLLLYKYETYVSSFDMIMWALFYLGASITMAFALTPTTYIAILSGYFLGYQGLIYLVIAYQAASVWGYFFAQKVDDGFVDQLSGQYPKTILLLDRLRSNEMMTIVLARISPALPFALMNVILSISKVQFRTFFIGGLIGMLPRSLFFVWVGLQASKLSEAINNRDHIYLSILLIVVAGFGMYKIFKPRNQTPR